MDDSIYDRRPRSYVRRQGRLTRGQRRALDHLWPRYALECDGHAIDLDAVFARRAFRVLEIGFGNGEAIAEMAASNPQQDFLGIEVHRPGIGHLLYRLDVFNLTNVRVMCADALSVLQSQIEAQSFDRVQLFFPDPWPKKRHRKRRIVQDAWVSLLVEKMKLGGTLHLATDWEDYANQMLAVLSDNPELTNSAPKGGFGDRPMWRPLTKFERRGLGLGHLIRDLQFERRLSSANS